jgi:site-specific DNA recombinase
MSTEPPIVARVYVRISKVADGSTLGVERQEPPCRDFCDGHGWPVAEVYVDNNSSAYREGVKREEFERLLADVRADHRAGCRNAIVTWQADRLLRTVEDASAIVAIAKRYGTLVANVGGTIDLSAADGRRHLYELAVAAQYESELKSERLKLKHLELRRGGKWQGGSAPLAIGWLGPSCTAASAPTAPARTTMPARWWSAIWNWNPWRPKRSIAPRSAFCAAAR